MTTKKEISIWTKVILLILEDKKGNPSVAMGKLKEILKKKKKDYLLQEIAKKVKDQHLKRHGIKIFLAKNHQADIIEKIKQKLLSMSGKTAENLEICLDEDLVGGFRVKTGNFLIKASIKDFLNEIKNTVKKENG